MILVDGQPIPHQSDRDLLISLLRHPHLVVASDRLKATPLAAASDFLRRCGGRHVYVFQREYATVNPALVQVVGMDEATTCVGIVIRNRENGMTSIAHMDSAKTVGSGLIQMLSLVMDGGQEAPLDIHLVGGFDDAVYEHGNGGSEIQEKAGYSLPLCTKIIFMLQARKEKFHIQTLCVLEHNTRRNTDGDSLPILTGFMVETSSGSIMPAQFDTCSRCPDEIIRRIRITVSSDDPSCRGKLLETYHTKLDQFHIAPCSWRWAWSSWASSLQQLSDSELLLQCSTSPSAEDSDFVPNHRRVFSYLTSNPDWKHGFPERKARVFKRTADGGWSRSATRETENHYANAFSRHFKVVEVYQQAQAHQNCPRK